MSPNGLGGVTPCCVCSVTLGGVGGVIPDSVGEVTPDGASGGIPSGVGCVLMCVNILEQNQELC